MFSMIEEDTFNQLSFKALMTIINQIPFKMIKSITFNFIYEDNKQLTNNQLYEIDNQNNSVLLVDIDKIQGVIIKKIEKDMTSVEFDIGKKDAKTVTLRNSLLSLILDKIFYLKS
jgi:hypothetical protein